MFFLSDILKFERKNMVELGMNPKWSHPEWLDKEGYVSSASLITQYTDYVINECATKTILMPRLFFFKKVTFIYTLTLLKLCSVLQWTNPNIWVRFKDYYFILLNKKLKYLPSRMRNNFVNCNVSKELSCTSSVLYTYKKIHNCIKKKNAMLIKNKRNNRLYSEVRF